MVLTVSSFADFDKTTTTINGERLETVRQVLRFRRFKGLTKFRESFDGCNSVNDGEKEGTMKRSQERSGKEEEEGEIVSSYE